MMRQETNDHALGGTVPNKENYSLKQLFIFFLACLKISAFTFGGGYVIVPLQSRKFSQELKWIDEEKIIDLVAMAQSAPGPVAVSSSTAMGHFLFGVPGALAAAIATILPPIVILSIISLFYDSFAQNPIVRAVLRGMQAAVSALIVYTVYGLASKVIKKENTFYIALMFICILLILLYKFNIIYAIMGGALTSLIYYFLSRKAEA